MLVVTFGRAASQELRERVRAQLVEAERVLGDDPAAAVDAGPRLRAGRPCCASGTAEQRRLGHRRVTEALAGFDAATIATTHQFCSMVLDSLGVAGDTDSRARLVEDLDDLVKETVDDLYLRAFAFDADGPVFNHAEALAIARAAVGDPQATPRARRRGPRHRRSVGGSASPARSATSSTGASAGSGSCRYDDLLTQLAARARRRRRAAAQRMRQRWSIVLVDEFQDTDPVQWQVLDRAFSGHATMVLIGDPKQAIYAFRGGDVTTYLEAAETAAPEQTLSVNWRSDKPLLDSFQRLLAGAALGDDRIVVRDVEAHHDESRLVGAPSPAPFRVRVVRREELGRRGNATLAVGQVRPHIAQRPRPRRTPAARLGATFEGEPLRPRDVAVISYRHADLAAVREALLEVGVPAVIAGGGSVFATPAAVEWLTLLEALEQPHRSARVRSAALTCFFGHTAERARRARRRPDRRGRRDAARLGRAVHAPAASPRCSRPPTSPACPRGCSAEVGGDRRLTDLRHIGEALHEVTLTERHGLVSLLTWLREQVAEGRAGRGVERTRRLDSDAAAVQLVTIHASKGLEYPVVYLPAVADRHRPEADPPAASTTTTGTRCLNVGGGGAHWADHCRRWADEEAGEWLRLLYVAITRAKSQVVCWWAPTKNAVASPLHRMLMRDADAAERAGLAAGPRRRRRRRAVRRVARPRRPVARARDPRRPRRRPAAARDARARRPLVHPAGRHRVAAHVVLLAQQGRGRRRLRPARSSASPRSPARTTRTLEAGRRACTCRRRRATCRRRWPSCRSARRSARWCTPCSSTPTRTRPTCARSCSATSTSSSAGGRSTSTARSSPTRWSRSATRRSARSPARRCAQVPLTDRLREMDFELPLAGGDLRRRRTSARRPRAAAGAAPARRRPGARRTPTR